MWTTICDNYMVEANGVSDCLHKTEKKVFENQLRQFSCPACSSC